MVPCDPRTTDVEGQAQETSTQRAEHEEMGNTKDEMSDSQATSRDKRTERKERPQRPPASRHKQKSVVST